jgi:hypothetical protein
MGNCSTTKIFHLSAPMEEENRGDTDYVKSVTDAFETQKGPYTIDWITGKTTQSSKFLYDVSSLLHSIEKVPKYKIQENDERTEAVSNIQNYVELEKSSRKILHLQLRFPETGCMVHFNEIKKFNIPIVITCHEFFILQSEQRKETLKYLTLANKVIFFNQRDLDEAINFTGSKLLRENCSLSQVAPTLKLTKELSTIEVKLTKKNILCFGLMRENKGFDIGIELAKQISSFNLLNPNNSPLNKTKVIFAGKPHHEVILKRIVCAKFGLDLSTFHDPNWEMDYLRSLFIGEHLKNFLLGNIGPFSDQSYTLLVEEIKKKIISSDNLKTAIKNILGKNVPTETVLSFYSSVVQSKQEKLDTRIKYLVDHYQERNPISWRLNVTPKQLDELAEQSKYCLKIEGKGFANNSTSIVNAISRKLIVFSNIGELTAEEFISGKYKDALVLVNKRSKDKEVPKYILDRLIEREGSDSQECNRQTLHAAETVVDELFNEKNIYENHVSVYDGCF